MRFTTSIAAAALAGIVAATPQGVTDDLPPPSYAEGCQQSYDGTFGIGLVDVMPSASGRIVKRQGLNPNDIPANELSLTLENGDLKDQIGRFGYIASQGQLQFDNPIQAGAIITTGFSVCSNGSLALESAVWFECISGSFSNLYDRSQGAQCSEVYIQILDSDQQPITDVSPSSGGDSTAEPTGATTGDATASPTATGDSEATTGTGAPTGTASGSGDATTTATETDSTASPTDSQVSQISDTAASGAGGGPNSATSIHISGTWLALVAGAIGLGAILL